MINPIVQQLFKLSLCTFGYLQISSAIALAQVTSDNTTNTQVTQSGNTAEITGGENRGSNLFHSFQDFSVGTGNEAFFNNTTEINNIFSRVTGGNISNINGLIRANGSANLFLINPVGVVLGEGASLNVGGSFYGSSASSILFEEGEFSATDLENPPLLTVNAPIGLSFRDNPGVISVSGTNLSVASGQNLSLIGGEINIDSSNINASGGTVNLGAVSEAGTIAIDEAANLDFSNVSLADISLSNNSGVNISGNGGGGISINALNLSATASTLNAGVNADTSDPQAQGGDININATETVVLENSSFIANLLAGAAGNAGDIRITTSLLELKGDAAADTRSILAAGTQGEGNAGDIIVNATDINLTDSSFFVTQVQPDATGNAGNIEINTTNLTLNGTADNFSSLIANTEGVGNAGGIRINAMGEVRSNGFSQILSQVRPGARGNSGDINVQANSLDLTESQLITNTNRAEGSAGSVIIDITEDITLSRGTLVLSQVREGAIGEAGDINISARSLELNNSLVVADSSGIGSSGDININVEDTITLQGLTTTERELDINVSEGRLPPSGITTGLDEFINPDTELVENSGQGEAGSINISARQLNLTDLASVTSNVEETTVGGGGEVQVNVDSLRINNNAAISTFTVNDSNAGSITINSETIDLLAGGRLVSATDGAGDAGSINLNVSDRLNIDNADAAEAPRIEFNNQLTNELLGRTGLFANATERSTGNAGSILVGKNLNAASAPQEINIANGAEIKVDSAIEGNAGDVRLSTDSLSLSNGAKVTATNAAGEGGNIDLTAKDRITLSGDSLISSAATNASDGGNIFIDTDFIVVFPGNSDILANAEQGQGGNINIIAESLFGIKEGVQNSLTNDINASSEVIGLDGTITIDTPDVDPAEGSTDLPTNVIEPKKISAQACNANIAKTKKNSLTVAGKGGVPISPESPLNSESIIVEGSTADIASAVENPITTNYGQVVPARGVKITKDGDIILTASRTEESARTPKKSRNCRSSAV